MGNIAYGLTSVEIGYGDNIQEVNDKIGIEEACHTENYAKYSQTSTTPTMHGPLARDLGFQGDSPACEAILNGTYIPPPGTDPYTIEYLNHLRRIPNITHSPPNFISTDDFKAS